MGGWSEQKYSGAAPETHSGVRRGHPGTDRAPDVRAVQEPAQRTSETPPAPHTPPPSEKRISASKNKLSEGPIYH